MFRKGIEPCCIYCAHSTALDEASLACIKLGIVSAGYQCHKFKYDPFKRIPPRPVRLNVSQYKKEDFLL